jgi:general secretion pathway protein K
MEPMRLPPTRPPRRNRGAAVLMALFVATLATLIVTGLFWNQFVLLRTIENQQLVSQSRLLLRGALDWARAILREDGARSSFDGLDEPWAQPLAETRLDQLGETATLASQATIAGGIDDAQARMNLRNLIGGDGLVVEKELFALRRLAGILGVPEQTADLIAVRMQEALQPRAADGRESTERRPIPLVLPLDLLAIPGIDAEAARRLADYVVVLDEPTPVNVNTAKAEVIAARVPGLSLQDGRALVEQRLKLGHFRDVAEVQTNLRDKAAGVSQADVATTSRYFLVSGRVRLDRADTRIEALVKRGAPGASVPIAVLWHREL